MASLFVLEGYHVILFIRQMMGISRKIDSSLIFFDLKKRFTFVNSQAFLKMRLVPLIPASLIGVHFASSFILGGYHIMLFVR